MVVNKIKAVLHARVVKIACCRTVGLMHIGAYTDYWQDINVLWSTVRPSLSLSWELEQKSAIGLHIAFRELAPYGQWTFVILAPT